MTTPTPSPAPAARCDACGQLSLCRGCRIAQEDGRRLAEQIIREFWSEHPRCTPREKEERDG